MAWVLNQMIKTAEEFLDLRTSKRPEEYLRSVTEAAPFEVWCEVLNRFPEMKVWVARNKTVPMRILEQLALDSDTCVRDAVATKNKLSERLMLMLAKDPDPAVRTRIAYNKNASDEVLRILAQDADPSVSEAARGQLTRRNA